MNGNYQTHLISCSTSFAKKGVKGEIQGTTLQCKKVKQ